MNSEKESFIKLKKLVKLIKRTQSAKIFQEI